MQPVFLRGGAVALLSFSLSLLLSISPVSGQAASRRINIASICDAVASVFVVYAVTLPSHLPSCRIFVAKFSWTRRLCWLVCFELLLLLCRLQRKMGVFGGKRDARTILIRLPESWHRICLSRTEKGERLFAGPIEICPFDVGRKGRRLGTDWLCEIANRQTLVKKATHNLFSNQNVRYSIRKCWDRADEEKSCLRYQSDKEALPESRYRICLCRTEQRYHVHTLPVDPGLALVIRCERRRFSAHRFCRGDKMHESRTQTTKQVAYYSIA